MQIYVVTYYNTVSSQDLELCFDAAAV